MMNCRNSLKNWWVNISCSLPQIHIFIGVGRFAGNFDLCAISIGPLHIWIMAMGCHIVPYHRMRQRHIDRCVRIHTDGIVSRTILCNRESTQKITGKICPPCDYTVCSMNTWTITFASLDCVSVRRTCVCVMWIHFLFNRFFQNKIVITCFYSRSLPLPLPLM